MSHPKDVVCPTCNAQIGERCKWDHGGKHRTWHHSREALVFTPQALDSSTGEGTPPAHPGTVADNPESSPEETDEERVARIAKALGIP